MGYIGITELNPNLPSRLQVTASSAGPQASAGVLKVIAGVSAEIDAAAGLSGYVTPIDPTASPHSYELVQMFAIYGAGWRVLSVAMPDFGGPKDTTSLAGTYRTAYQAAIAGLKDGSVILSDAPQGDGAGGRTLPRSFHTSNTGATAGVVPRITIDQPF